MNFCLGGGGCVENEELLKHLILTFPDIYELSALLLEILMFIILLKERYHYWGKAEYMYTPKNTKNIQNIQRIRVLLSGTAESRNLPDCESFLL